MSGVIGVSDSDDIVPLFQEALSHKSITRYSVRAFVKLRNIFCVYTIDFLLLAIVRLEKIRKVSL